MGLWWALLLLAGGCAAAAAWGRLRRERVEADVRRLLELERVRGPADPEVRALRLRVWRHLLRYPDPVDWGRYRWKAPADGGL